MLGEILVALITTVGTVWVAFISLQAGTRRGRRRYSEPLLSLCALWGRARGVAEAAFEDCSRAMEERREEGPRSVLTAAERVDLFWAETQPGQEMIEALRGEFSATNDGLLMEFFMYEDAVKAFRKVLRQLGDRIDAMSPASRPSEIGVDRYLLLLQAELPKFDAAFERCLSSYLQRKDGALLYQVRRRLRRQAEERYENFQPGGKGVFAPQPGPESADHPARGDGARSDGAEPPPCGYCIWRCPHAPAGADAPADRTAVGLTGA